MNYWYVANDREIFLDIDSRKSLYRAMRVLRAECLKHQSLYPLAIDKIWFFKTDRRLHGHLVITLRGNVDANVRALWALWAGSDRLRAVYVFKRIWLQKRGMRIGADLLVSRQRYHRKPDVVCYCKAKHKEKVVTDVCPALHNILGEWRSVEFFPRAGRERMKPWRVHFGRITKKQLLNWETQT